MSEETKFYLHIQYVDTLNYKREMVLGPWASKQAASDYSDNLTNSRIGEQILNHLKAKSLIVQEA